MIGILLDGETEFLETEPGTSINIKLESPIFGDGERLSPGSYSLPFTIPIGDRSPSNASKIKNPDVIENNEAYQLQKATLFASSEVPAPIPFKKGNLKAKNAGDDKASAYFTFGLNSLNENFKTAKLRKVVAENIVIGGTDITKKIYIQNNSGSNWNITVNGKAYTGSDIFTLRNAINDDFAAGLDSGQYLPHCDVTLAGATPSGLIVGDFITIKLQVLYTGMFGVGQDSVDPLQELSATTDEADYLFEGDLGTYQAEFDTFMALYNNTPYPNDKLRFPVLFNGDPHGEVLKDGEIVNGVNSTGLIQNEFNWGLENSRPLEIKNYNSIQPFLRRKWILDKIAETFGFVWEGDFYDHADVDNMLEWNTAGLDVPQLFIGAKKFVFWKRSFNLSELVPDITVVEYLKRLGNRYNLAIYENEQTKKVRIAFRESIAKSLIYDDITAISSPRKNTEPLQIAGFTLSLKKDDTDTTTSDESVIVGTSEETVEMECGRLFQQASTIIELRTVSGPRVIQKFGENGMMRTFYYQDIVDVAAFTYPSAGINGATIYEGLNDFILLIGLYNVFWKYWMHYRRNNSAGICFS